MKATLLVPSKYMQSAEFGLGTVPRLPLVTIDDAKLEKQDGGKGETWGLLCFREKWAKPLKMIATHKRALVLMFGDETDHWKGKRIGLYSMAGNFQNDSGTAVRISGSPDIKTPITFFVKNFGTGKTKYELRVLSLNGAFDPALYVPFGKMQGQRYEDLTEAELSATLLEIGGALERPDAKKQPPPPWVVSGKAALSVLGVEREKRLVAAVPDAGAAPAEPDAAPPEPGADG